MPVQDGMQEAVIRAVITELPRAIKEPDNYEARANLMWAAQQALFGIADMGKGHGERVEHKMEHILSARYNCAHGAGLAVVVPPFRKHMCRLNPAKYRQFAENVFHIDCVGLSDYEAGMKGIDRKRGCRFYPPVPFLQKRGNTFQQADRRAFRKVLYPCR